MNCKDCNHYKYVGKTRHSSIIDGTCQNPDIPFPLVSSDGECLLTRSKLHCRNCDYWIEAETTTRDDDIGGCIYGGRYFPMLLNETCALKEPWKSEVEKIMLNK